VAWKPYKRLYTYVGPYKWRFIFGLALGFLFGATQGCLPLVLQKVTSAVFHGGAPNPRDLAHHPELLDAGGSVKSIVFVCLLIPAVMTARSLMGYGNSYYMNWVSNRVVTDIRNQLFAKIVGQSMDFFNRMRAGMLMSRSTMLQFRNVMRMVKSMEVTGPLIEVLGAMGFGLALLYVYVANLSAGRFLALIGGIFLLYDPVKTLSKMHIVMQRSVAATVGIFGILDTPSTIQDPPDAE